MVSMNVFQQDAFRTIELTTAIEKVPYKPDGLEKMGAFTDAPQRTEAMAVEERQGKLVLVPFSDRGAPGGQRTTERRKMRYFQVPRIRQEDTLYAREIAGIRAFGQETELMQVQKEVGRRMVGPTGLRSNLQYTQEFHKLAAIQGKLLDTDGSVKFDWFAEFGITPNPIVPFNLKANVAGGLRPLAANLKRNMIRKGQGAFLGTSRIVALCGDQFFDKLITHTDVEKTYANWEAAAALRQGLAFKDFEFAEITWLNYRGSDDTIAVDVALSNGQAAATAAGNGAGLANGMTISGPNIPAGTTVTGLNPANGNFNLSSGNFAGADGHYVLNFGNGINGGGDISIPSNKARFFPVGAPGVFQRGLSPSDSFEFVNTLGKPEYANIIPDRDRNEWVKLELTSYPLHICTRPDMLFEGTMDALAD